MKHLFLDTSIILDFLTERLPRYTLANEIFMKAGNNEICISSSSLSLANCFYILGKEYKFNRNSVK